ncbi:hypothetical protein [Paenibacillus lutrae]|uniref:Uncharacterized protein n=1 Tax=Paenibacillus lutrae TaxID=2078573 RepID=A0A7X3JZT2_9BACL|nr:hypothetical protein [Paenibacillus lutrae]MVP00367.1 hypothetical protein [Paenibacillus lutrae]
MTWLNNYVTVSDEQNLLRSLTNGADKNIFIEKGAYRMSEYIKAKKRIMHLSWKKKKSQNKRGK